MCPADEWIQLSTDQKLVTLRQLYLEYYDQLYNFALKIMGDGDAAEDVVQDLFLSIYSRGVDEIPIRTSVRAYLYGSVYNLSLLHLRRVARVDRLRDLTENRDNDWEQMGAHSTLILDQPHPIDLISLEDRRQSVIRCINLLPERQRLAFTLRWDGLEIKEIAETMAISVVAARKLIEKAIISLKRALTNIP